MWRNTVAKQKPCGGNNGTIHIILKKKIGSKILNQLNMKKIKLIKTILEKKIIKKEPCRETL